MNHLATIALLWAIVCPYSSKPFSFSKRESLRAIQREKRGIDIPQSAGFSILLKKTKNPVALGLLFFCLSFAIYWEWLVVSVWDPLRVLDDFAVAFDIYVTPVVLLVSLVLFVVSLKAYKKNPSKRLLLVSVAFGFFAARWALKLLDIFFSPGRFFSAAAQDVFDLVILFSLFFSLLQK